MAIPKYGFIKLAMRRIIKEPKRWTWEDKKAGRLPEVGWVVRATGVNEDARIAAINNDAVCVVFEDGGFITLHVSGITPIETPEEKAQREEDEFINYVLHHKKSQINSSEELVAAKRAIKLTYKLQLSGELSAPKWGE